MSPERCARCGREREDESFTLPPPDATARGRRTWGSIQGRSICPSCQTDEEAVELESRFVAMVIEEVERRQNAGEAPDEFEPPLVGSAMDTRSRRREATPDHFTVVPDSPSAALQPAGPAGQVIRVAITGAFLTRHPLSVPLQAYEDFRLQLSARLTRPRWCVDDLRPKGGTYRSGGGFTEEVPLVIARRDGADLRPWLDVALGTEPPEGGDPGDVIVDMTAAATTVDVYDLGVAVLTTWVTARIVDGASYGVVARAIKDLVLLRAPGGRAPLASCLQDFAKEVAREFGDAVESVASNGPAAEWLSRGSAHSKVTADESGRLLWLHPVLVVEAQSPGGLASQLAPPHHETLDIADTKFVAGIGWSGVVSSRRSQAETPLKLTLLHWAYYALYMAMDRGLLQVLDRPTWKRSARLSQLELEARDVYLDYLRIMEAQARLDSHLSSLGGDELAIWQTIAKVQGFEAVFNGVERKLEALQKVAEHRVTEADAYRSRRVAKSLGFLSVLTVVTVVGAVIGLLFGSRSDSSDTVGLRVIAVVSAVAVAFLVYWIAFVRTERSAGRPPRRRWRIRNR